MELLGRGRGGVGLLEIGFSLPALRGFRLGLLPGLFERRGQRGGARDEPGALGLPRPGRFGRLLRLRLELRARLLQLRRRRLFRCFALARAPGEFRLKPGVFLRDAVQVLLQRAGVLLRLGAGGRLVGKFRPELGRLLAGRGGRLDRFGPPGRRFGRRLLLRRQLFVQLPDYGQILRHVRDRELQRLFAEPLDLADPNFEDQVVLVPKLEVHLADRPHARVAADVRRQPQVEPFRQQAPGRAVHEADVPLPVEDDNRIEQSFENLLRALLSHVGASRSGGQADWHAETAR